MILNHFLYSVLANRSCYGNGAVFITPLLSVFICTFIGGLKRNFFIGANEGLGRLIRNDVKIFFDIAFRF